MIVPAVLLVLCTILGVMAYRVSPETFWKGVSRAKKQARDLSVRVPLAILSAGFLAHIVPKDFIVRTLGADSGVTGILSATLIGGFLPGGPAVSFPVALIFVNAGIGPAQLVALLTAWSVFAIHRVLIYELPLLGAHFSRVRLLSASPLPLIAGFAAMLILRWF